MIFNKRLVAGLAAAALLPALAACGDEPAEEVAEEVEGEVEEISIFQSKVEISTSWKLRPKRMRKRQALPWKSSGRRVTIIFSSCRSV
ncbi:hypothetical protein [Indiicoccus explosivorum]|uniref:hypothetical protein n=1 Tax=Indiicoccus explosivorum TaxID=1917864 RepID=UPI001F4D62FE|nr:hypothetical protein [Indiicoccus explosivorum]